METSAPIDNYRWRILKDKEAEKYHIQIVKIDEGRAVLNINVAYIPENMSIVTYLNWLRETGVILNYTDRAKHP